MEQETAICPAFDTAPSFHGRPDIKEAHMRLGSRRGGVTLIEMLAVLVIIGIVATMATLHVINSMRQARVQAARAQLKTFSTAIAQFKMTHGRFPAKLVDLETDPGGLSQPFPQGGYLDSVGIPNDPWGNGYVYSLGGTEGYAVRTLGENGVAGGQDFDRDLSSDDPVGPP